jgi:hypothetical protein
MLEIRMRSESTDSNLHNSSSSASTYISELVFKTTWSYKKQENTSRVWIFIITLKHSLWLLYLLLLGIIVAIIY